MDDTTPTSTNNEGGDVFEEKICTSAPKAEKEDDGVGVDESSVHVGTNDDKDDAVDPSTPTEEDLIGVINGTESNDSSFGARFLAFRQKMQERFSVKASDTSGEDREGTSRVDGVPEKNAPQVPSVSDYESLRPLRISVTIVKENVDSKWGFSITNSHAGGNDPDKVVIQALSGAGMLKHTPLKRGDILVSVNGQKCTDAGATTELLVQYPSVSPVTLEVETPQGNPQLVQAVVQKRTPDTVLGIGFSNQTSKGRSFLEISHLPSDGLLGHSTLNKGDMVLAVNGTPCHHWSADEAAEALRTSQEPQITIVALSSGAQSSTEPTRAQRFLRQAKRAGIALGGGTLVGVGLIFIPTLPPPFGEVLIIGGVSVLGTEFEAPKRVMKSARDSLERAVGREETSPEQDVEQQNESTTITDKFHTGNESVAISDSAAAVAAVSSNRQESTSQERASLTENADNCQKIDDPQLKKRTMTDRFKSFGRTVVLPFLDQVVGDRNELEQGLVEGSVVEPGDSHEAQEDGATVPAEESIVSEDRIEEAIAEPEGDPTTGGETKSPTDGNGTPPVKESITSRN